MWVYVGWFPDGWWNQTVTVQINNEQTVTCSPGEMLEAAAGSFSVVSQFFYDDTEKNMDNHGSNRLDLNVARWKQLHKELLTKVRKKENHSLL